MTTHILYGGNLEPVGSFFGTRDSQRVGYYLSAAGDVNADGYDDFMVACYHHYNVASEDWNGGGVFLFLGKQNFPDVDEQPITNADAIFEGYRKNDMVAYNIAGKGDFNGDGYDDMLVGAPGKWETDLPNNGYLYVVYGRPEADWPKPSKIKDIADFTVTGESYLDQLGYAVDFAGDLNQDGFDEIVVSAAFKDVDGQQWAGKVYVIAGSADGFHGEVPIAEAASASFVFPIDKATLGFSVAGVEDVNADGYPDFMIGAEGVGHCFLLFGKKQLDWGQNFNLSAADVIFTPEKRLDRPGWQIRPAGDVNADNIPDFLISGVSLNYSFGKFYLLLGRTSWPDSLSLTQADASFIGEHTGAHAGMSMDAVGDFDGDGFDDFAVGSRWLEYNGLANAGKEYLIKGRASGWERDVSLKTVPDYYAAPDSIYCLGWGTAGTGDFDGDFRPEFITSAPFNSNNGLHWNGRIFIFKADYPLPDITGTCQYFHTAAPVHDVTVNLNGKQHRQLQTGTSGDYVFTVGLNQSWELSPSREKDMSALSAHDAALIARFSVNENFGLLNPVAADVNLDSQIDIMDGVYILRAVANFPPDSASHAGEWNFTPESRLFPDVTDSHTGADFSGFIIGDVDLSWPDAMRQTISAQMQLAKLQPAVQHQAGHVTIPLTVTSPTDAYSFEAKFTCIDGSLATAEFELNPQAKNWHVETNISGERIYVAAFGTTPLPQESILGRLNLATPVPGTIEIDHFRINDYQPQKAVIQLAENGNDDSKPTTFGLSQNYPNPFNGETLFEFSLPEAAQVTLKIYNTLGQEIRQILNTDMAAGIHQFHWSAEDLTAGIYFYELKTRHHRMVRKLILLP